MAGSLPAKSCLPVHVCLLQSFAELVGRWEDDSELVAYDPWLREEREE
eukprot:SAG22_NODE_1258_length_4983_cov_2.401925_9_plen_48_part_00